jgi:hypothetical protein
VIEAMARALNSFVTANAFRGIRLFGHSGGGTVAVLLAAHVPGTEAVVTLGANLDIDAWAAHHRFSYLAGSLNPAKTGTPGCRETHYYGDGDKQTPPALFAPTIASRRGAVMRIVKGHDHNCCWERVWPMILRQGQ